MESHGEILKNVTQLALLNAELHSEIDVLEAGRNSLERQCQSQLTSLNQTIRELPAVIDVLRLENPPSLKLASVGGQGLMTRSIQQRRRQLSTLRTVDTVISNLCGIEGQMNVSLEEARMNKLDAAEVTSKAAVHIKHCSSILGTISAAQTQTQVSMDQTSRDITRAQRQIDENQQLSLEMSAKARSHDKEAEGNKVLLWSTCWIPVVNFVTIPLALSLEQANMNAAASCRTMVTGLQAEVQEKKGEEFRLQSTSRLIDEALTELKAAHDDATKAAGEASGLRNQARALTDKYNLLTTRIRDVLQALGYVSSDMRTEHWDSVRLYALQSLRGMLETLRERDLLAAECLPVLSLMETIPSVEECRAELEGL